MVSGEGEPLSMMVISACCARRCLAVARPVLPRPQTANDRPFRFPVSAMFCACFLVLGVLHFQNENSYSNIAQKRCQLKTDNLHHSGMVSKGVSVHGEKPLRVLLHRKQLFFVVWGMVCLGGMVLVGCPSQQAVVRRPPPPVRRVVVPKTPVVPRLPRYFSKVYRFPLSVPLAPSRGPIRAPVQVVELLNPVSSVSKQIQRIRAVIWKQYPGAVRWTIRMNPQLGKDRGYFYARALFAANKLGIVWPYLKRFHQRTGALGFRQLLALADASGISAQRFELALMNESYKMVIDRDMRWSRALGMTAKPGLFINGAFLPAPYTEERVLQAIKDSIQIAKAHLKQGVEAKDLYAKLTKDGARLAPLANVPHAIGVKRYNHIPFALLEGIPTRGPGDAPVHILEFSDFTCRPCRKAYKWLHTLLQKHPKALRFSFKFYPIGIHKESYRACELAAAAQDRRKFWAVYDILFQQQKRLFQGELIELAKQAGLSTRWIAGELDRKSYRRRVRINHYHGRILGVRAVPTLFINGYKVIGVRTYKQLLSIVQEERWKAGSPDPAYP